MLELAEHASDESFRLFFFDGRGLATFFQRRENFFDFAVNRKSPGARFGEHQSSIDDHVELTRFAGGDFRLLAERGTQ